MLSMLGGCAFPARAVQFVGPDGSRDWWVIECRGGDAACLKQAGDTCPKGYDAAERSGAGFTTQQAKPPIVRNNELIVKCKGASAPGVAADPGCNTGEPRPNHCYDQALAKQQTGREYLPPADASALPAPAPSAQPTTAASSPPAPSTLPTPLPSAVAPPAPSSRPRAAPSATHRP